MNLTVQTSTEDQTHRLGVSLGALLRPGDAVSLDGQLGAGKTRLVRGIVEGAGLSTATVNSPTYVIAQEYSTPQLPSSNTRSVRIVHVDAYRLRGVDEIETVGWDALVMPDARTGDRPILLVEWADRIERALPFGDDRCRIRIAHGDDAPEAESRVFEITCPDVWHTRAGWVAFETALQAINQPHVDSGERSVSSQQSKRLGTVCPITGKPVQADSPTYPFADERARLADLSRWLSGGYVVSREMTTEDVDEDQPGRTGS